MRRKYKSLKSKVKKKRYKNSKKNKKSKKNLKINNNRIYLIGGSNLFPMTFEENLIVPEMIDHDDQMNFKTIYMGPWLKV